MRWPDGSGSGVRIQFPTFRGVSPSPCMRVEVSCRHSENLDPFGSRNRDGGGSIFSSADVQIERATPSPPGRPSMAVFAFPLPRESIALAGAAYNLYNTVSQPRLAGTAHHKYKHKKSFKKKY
ncbi:hypothetical protein PAHAL_3G235100 [Panicum hallii]|jgi:hypothetical protein|uniref:Uncharacterized protein n=1 Tax=Panicum hallii TaxID=206008 RepID=A0A2T8KJ33_9POAL|nr:hypothetical protein PAHAL_3G235100 [Panicum hallii]